MSRWRAAQAVIDAGIERSTLENLATAVTALRDVTPNPPSGPRPTRSNIVTEKPRE